MRSAGRSATSGSRLFISMRSAASCCQPLQESVVPRGARMVRGRWVSEVFEIAAEKSSELGITMCTPRWLTKRILLSDKRKRTTQSLPQIGSRFHYNTEEGG